MIEGKREGGGGEGGRGEEEGIEGGGEMEGRNGWMEGWKGARLGGERTRGKKANRRKKVGKLEDRQAGRNKSRQAGGQEGRQNGNKRVSHLHFFLPFLLVLLLHAGRALRKG